MTGRTIKGNSHFTMVLTVNWHIMYITVRTDSTVG